VALRRGGSVSPLGLKESDLDTLTNHTDKVIQVCKSGDVG